MTAYVYTNIPQIKLIFDNPKEQFVINERIRNYKLRIVEQRITLVDYEPKDYYIVTGTKGRLMKMIYGSGIPTKFELVKTKPILKTIIFDVKGLR